MSKKDFFWLITFILVTSYVLVSTYIAGYSRGVMDMHKKDLGVINDYRDRYNDLLKVVINSGCVFNETENNKTYYYIEIK